MIRQKILPYWRKQSFPAATRQSIIPGDPGLSMGGFFSLGDGDCQDPLRSRRSLARGRIQRPAVLN